MGDVQSYSQREHQEDGHFPPAARAPQRREDDEREQISLMDLGREKEERERYHCRRG